MRFFRKILSVLTAGAVIASFSACETADTPENDGLKVITTNFPPYDFVKQISEGAVIPEMLLSGGQDSHSFEPTAQQIIEISEADIFICTGGESDTWVDEILMSMDSDVAVIKMMDCVEPICAEEHDHDHEEHEHDHSEYDEHVWTSPKNAMKIAEKISEAMCSADPDNKEKYEKGISEYKAELEALDKELSQTADSLTAPLIFGDRFPFLYMAHDYGIEYYAAFAGCSSETEPSAARMTELIDAARENTVKTIFYVEFSTQKVADTVAEAAGANTALFHSCHSVSDEDLQNGESYVSLMRKKIEKLKGI